ncbi:uncharacterized protein LOC111105844 [Crassostrea virginica]
MAWIALIFGLSIALGVCIICLMIYLCMRCSNNSSSRKISLEEKGSTKNASQSTITFLASSSHKTFLFDDFFFTSPMTSHNDRSEDTDISGDDYNDTSDDSDDGKTKTYSEDHTTNQHLII